VLHRSWQLGTVQVDYVMPERFNLEYTGSDNQKHRPVVIHRAPFGSLERFIGILIEHFADAFPTWLAPMQAAILPITDAQAEYAANLQRRLAAKEIRSTLDDRNEKIGYKIREAETKKIPYMLVVGAKEAENNTVAVRKRRAGDLGSMPIEAVIDKIAEEIQSKRLE
jgi:threonyl-tRNA synthetase